MWGFQARCSTPACRVDSTAIWTLTLAEARNTTARGFKQERVPAMGTGCNFFATHHLDALTAEHSPHHASAHMDTTQHTVFVIFYSLQHADLLSSSFRCVRYCIERIAQTWQSGSQHWRQGPAWSSRPRNRKSRASRRPQNPIPALSNSSGFLPGRQRGISSTPRRRAMTGAASPGKKAAA